MMRINKERFVEWRIPFLSTDRHTKKLDLAQITDIFNWKLKNL